MKEQMIERTLRNEVRRLNVKFNSCFCHKRTAWVGIIETRVVWVRFGRVPGPVAYPDGVWYVTLPCKEEWIGSGASFTDAVVDAINYFKRMDIQRHLDLRNRLNSLRGGL